MSRQLKLGCFLLFILVAFMGIEAYRYYISDGFDPDKIVKNSIFKDKTFETNIVEIVSKEGIKAYLFEDHTNPIISVDFMFKNTGIAYENEGYEGIGNLVSMLLTQGAGNLDNEQFEEELELNAINISFAVDYDDFTGSLLMITDNKEKAYNLFNLALTKARFDEDKINLAKQRLMHAFRSQTERPESVLGLEFAKEIYGDHPYGRNPIGNINAIAKMSKKDMQNYVRDNLTKDSIVVGISGDINEDEAKDFVDKMFADITPSREVNIEIPYADINFDGRNIKIDRSSAQNIAIFANIAPKRSDEDFYPLYIVNYIFGGYGLNSRLSTIARENEGLTYGIYSSISNRVKSNMLKGSFSSTPENYNRVIEIINDEWSKMGKKGISANELKSAKNYLLSSYNLRFASISNISSIIAYMQRYDLGIDFLHKRNEYVNNVTLEQANDAAVKYFDNNSVFVSIGSFDSEK